ncbi:MAG TPA: NAD(P)-dependent oxidoreductase [Streptosporangiaceae bacterium]|nr:NAD(P)-dependent oxidoreductase [Streptosporangiaceae bacterium]
MQDISVAVLGAGGTMGLPMTRNLARAGLRVTAWNRSPDKLAALTADGIPAADSPARAAAGADFVLTMLSDAGAVLATMNGPHGALAAMDASAIWLQMSTIGEQGTQDCAALAADQAVFVDAPVLGTRQPAEQGTLVVLASGPDQAREPVRPVFETVGQKTIWAGEAGAGTRLKLVANSWVLSVVEATAETIALAEALDVDPGQFLDAVAGGALDLPYLRLKAAAMASRSFDPAFALRLAAKDGGLVQDAAARRDLDLPLLRAVRDRMAEGAIKYGDLDFSATYLTSAPRPD